MQYLIPTETCILPIPPNGLQEGFNDPKIELDFAGVFKLSAKGVLTLLETDLKQTMPNGIRTFTR